MSEDNELGADADGRRPRRGRRGSAHQRPRGKQRQRRDRACRLHQDRGVPFGSRRRREASATRASRSPQRRWPFDGFVNGYHGQESSTARAMGVRELWQERPWSSGSTTSMGIAASETVTFTIDGSRYEIDLSDEERSQAPRRHERVDRGGPAVRPPPRRGMRRQARSVGVDECPEVGHRQRFRRRSPRQAALRGARRLPLPHHREVATEAAPALG